MATNGTADFTAVVGGQRKGIKKWKVCDGAGKNCVTGGNSTVGTLVEIGTDAQGNRIARYTAPAGLPAPAFCTPVTGGCQIVLKAIKGKGIKKKKASAPVTLFVPSSTHLVDLVWEASPTAGVDGYNVYRGTAPGGPYVKINPSLVLVLFYTDSAIQDGQTYYYVVTAVQNGLESPPSNEVQAVVPP